MTSRHRPYNADADAALAHFRSLDGADRATFTARGFVNAPGYLARCKACGDQVTHSDAAHRLNGHMVLFCAGCGKARHAKAVAGTMVADIVCNERCTSAKGPACDCSCGGENHGRG